VTADDLLFPRHTSMTLLSLFLIFVFSQGAPAMIPNTAADRFCLFVEGRLDFEVRADQTDETFEVG